MPTILGANTLSGGYNVANSLRMDGDQSDDSLSKSISGVNTTKFTLSFWTKYAAVQNIGSEGPILFSSENNSSDYIIFQFNTSNQIDFQFQGTQNRRITNRVFRDPAAWYHIVVAIDTTQGTAGDRLKIYVNGVQETSFATSTTNVSQSANISPLDETLNYSIGRYNGQSSDFCYDGYFAEFAAIYGTAYAASDFGEFDEDSPNIWKPKDFKDDVTSGSNGYYLEFKQSGTGTDANGMGADTSGNDNHFAVNNLTAVDQSTDTCTNNFTTLNPLFPESNISLTEGNLKASGDGSANWSSAITTFGLTSGKWYWEWTATSNNNAFAGIASEALVNSTLISDTTPYDQNGLILYFTAGRKTVDGTDTESHFTAWSSGTMSCALDLDSGTRTIKMYHNGSQTGDTIDLTANFASGDAVFPVFMVNSGSNTSIINTNFGSPFYANSSDAADANGYGAFEYAPPSGYYAINTKNLAEYG